MNGFQEAADHIRVLARATPNDRLMLVTGLKAIGKSVAVSGSGINDVEALQAADVGLAMGSGCSAAKEAADLVLTDNDFEATLRAVMWGRNIYHNVSRFLQFQVTVNISALATVFIGGIIFGESPLSAVQLLWINLIMDVLAAIAFATENPHPTQIRKERINASENIITKPMMRSVLTQAFYQIFVMLLLLYAGPAMFKIQYNLYTTELRTQIGDEEYPTNRLLHQTLMFQVFVMMNMFNMLNCRILDQMPVELEGSPSDIADDSRADEH